MKLDYNNISEVRESLTNKNAQYELLCKQYDGSKEKETNLESTIADIEEAKIFLQDVAIELQNSISVHISDFISSALTSIWGDEAFIFKLEFVQRRGQTEADMYLIDKENKIELKDLNSIGVGGGYLDIVALGLRIALWSLKKERGLIVLDQPFQNLDSNHVPLAGQLLKSLSKDLGIQFIMINHNPKLAESANKTYEIVKTNNVCEAIIVE